MKQLIDMAGLRILWLLAAVAGSSPVRADDALWSWRLQSLSAGVPTNEGPAASVPTNFGSFGCDVSLDGLTFTCAQQMETSVAAAQGLPQDQWGRQFVYVTLRLDGPDRMLVPVDLSGEVAFAVNGGWNSAPVDNPSNGYVSAGLAVDFGATQPGFDSVVRADRLSFEAIRALDDNSPLSFAGGSTSPNQNGRGTTIDYTTPTIAHRGTTLTFAMYGYERAFLNNVEQSSGANLRVSLSNNFSATILSAQAEPIPEPSAYALWLLGLIGVDVARRTSRRVGGSR